MLVGIRTSASADVAHHSHSNTAPTAGERKEIQMKNKQTEKILDYMTRFGSITPLEAMADLGCMRLAARIADLKREGYKIDTVIEAGKNRLGGVTRYARYCLHD